MDASSDDEGPPELVESGYHALSASAPSDLQKRVPITIVTGLQYLPQSLSHLLRLLPLAGYLGAGKSTLLNHILSAHHGKKIAVILNGLYFPIAPIPLQAATDDSLI